MDIPDAQILGICEIPVPDFLSFGKILHFFLRLKKSVAFLERHLINKDVGVPTAIRHPYFWESSPAIISRAKNLV